MENITWRHEVKTSEHPISLEIITKHWLEMHKDGHFFMRVIFSPRGKVNVLKPMGFGVSEMQLISLKIRTILKEEG